MASTEVSASTLCNRCLDGLWGRKGWQELDPEGAIIIHESREPKYMKYEVTFDALRASAQQNCWWCELLYDHMLQYIPDHKPTDVLVIHLNLEIPENVQPVQIHSIHVSIGKKDGTDEEPVTWMSVGIFTKSDVSPDYLVKQPREGEPSFLPSLTRDWLHDCLEHHTECALAKPQQLPSRVLDVTPNDDDGASIQLVCDREPRDQKYVYLSYRWGGPQQFALRSSSLETLQSKFLVDLLPQTLKDAVEVTRSLGIRYLWIDALCIIQDSAEDLVRELANMSDYIRLATLVIQPTGLTSVHDPFLAHSPGGSDYHVLKNLNVKRRTCLEIELDTGNGKPCQVVLEAKPRWYEPYKEPINSRGWVLQERLLCPRVLIFPSMGGMIWQCEKVETLHGKLLYGFMSRRNRMRLSRPRLLSHGPVREIGLTPHEIHDSWLTLVDDYSERDLTYQDDKLVAIAALASYYTDKYGDVLGSYCAGIWYNFLDLSLHWQYYGEHELQPLPECKRAPSWSWAASDKNMFWMHYKRPEDFPYRMEVVACEMTLVSPSLPFGQVSRGKLTIRATLIDLVWYPDGWTYEASLPNFTASSTSLSEITPPEETSRFGHGEPDFTDYQPTKPTRIRYLPLFRHTGLMLKQQQEEQEGQGGAYIRVGMCSLPLSADTRAKHMEILRDADREVVVIE